MMPLPRVGNPASLRYRAGVGARFPRPKADNQGEGTSPLPPCRRGNRIWILPRHFAGFFAVLIACAGADRLHLQSDTSRIPPATAIRAEFVRIVGGPGAGPGGFVSPVAVSVNAIGQAYVVDRGSDRVVRFEGDGEFVAEAGGFGWGDRQFNAPSGINAAGSLDVWVADTQNRRIVRLNSTLYWLGTITQDVLDGIERDLGYPTDVAVGPDGWLWFTDTDTDRLRRLSPFSETTETTAGFAVAGDLRNPAGLAIGPDGRIVVADTENDRIVLYDGFGNLLRSWGEGIVRRPAGVEVTAQGDVIVADTGNDRVLFLNRLLSIVGTLGGDSVDERVPHSPASFRGPRDVSVSPRGVLWVADTGNRRLVVFRLVRTTD